MSPIGRKAREDAPDLAADSPAGGFVLPRPLRKPVRHVMRLFNHGLIFSAPALAIFCGLLAGSGGFVWLRESAQGEKLVAQASSWAGFRIGDIEVRGVAETSRIDVLTHLDLGPERSLFSFDVHEARESLRKLPWVSEVRVSKSYPDKIVVDITERRPFAVWQNRGELMLIEADGHVIAPFAERFAGLPLVVGDGAEKAAAEMVRRVAHYPGIAAQVLAFVRVGDRRWNLTLASGQTVLLPEEGLEQQLAELARMEREQDLLKKDIELVDMRLADRLVIRLTPEAAEKRREIAKAAEKRT